MEILKDDIRRQSERVYPTDTYFSKFNSTVCVQHPGHYQQAQRTAKGFSGIVNVYTEQVR